MMRLARERGRKRTPEPRQTNRVLRSPVGEERAESPDAVNSSTRTRAVGRKPIETVMRMASFQKKLF